MPTSAVSPSPASPSPASPRSAPVVPLASSAARRAPGRLTRRAEFLRVAAKGRKAPMPGLVLQALKRDDDAPARLGFTVTKKVGNAVIRNRTRRRLKEAARLLLRDQPVAGADLVLIGRDATRSRDFAALREDLRRALAKAGVL
jgi:ribonuclease P protein component